jgi:hypothetical protein
VLRRGFFSYEWSMWTARKPNNGTGAPHNYLCISPCHIACALLRWGDKLHLIKLCIS